MVGEKTILMNSKAKDDNGDDEHAPGVEIEGFIWWVCTGSRPERNDARDGLQ